MGLGPMEISGGMSRVNDYAQLKQVQDNKGLVDQANFAGQFKKEVETRTETVKRGDDTSNNQKKFDAKEKGSNEYAGDGGKRREDEKESDKLSLQGRVIVKGATSSFDIRI